jgi:hypothetical protein
MKSSTGLGLFTAAICVVLFGCGSDCKDAACRAADTASDTVSDTDSDTDTDSYTDADSDTDTDADTDADSDTEVDSDDLLIEILEESDRAMGLVRTGDDFGHSIYWTKTVESGPCIYYSASFGECLPECVLPMECGADNQCHRSNSEFVDAGTISVSGLKSSLSLEVMSGGGPNYYYTDYWTPDLVDAEAFDEGDNIVASSDGGAFGAFEVSVTGSADIVTDLMCPPSLVDGESLVIQWTPGDASKDTIRFRMQSGNHATQFSSIVCETEDNGSLVVDASLVSAYLVDFHPFNRWELYRFRDGGAETENGRVVLRATSAASCGW